MPFSTQQSSEKTVVTVEEARLDASQVAAFREYMTQTIAGGGRELLLDLSQVNFMDSSGLGAIVGVYKEISGSGSLQLAAPQPSVNDLLNLTCMDKIFVIHNSVADALSAGSQS